MKRLLLLLNLCILFDYSFSQIRPYWAPVPPGVTVNKSKDSQRSTFPTKFKLFQLEIVSMRESMMSIVDSRSAQKTAIYLPNADGGIEQFEIVEASNFEPDLQARFPQIRAFSGRGITDKSATLKISLDGASIQTMVFRVGNDTEYIEPYSIDKKVYAVFRRQRPMGQLPWTCSTPDQALATDLNKRVELMAVGSSDGKLRTMRLAQSCNAEYSNYFGATSSAQVDLVLSAFNATLTRCNGVYEKDLALHLNLITNTTQVIYYNPSTDPYSTRISNWNNQLQTTLTNVIGEGNYDIGHMFGATGGGGNAGCIGCVCVDGSKGSGITSPADGTPRGDNFDIDYVAHEVGHQLGANHTFSMSNEGTGVNKEVGSGITIMGYAGITSQDVAPHSIDIFHQASIDQIQRKLQTKTCPISLSIQNASPVVTSPGSFTIPKSTPFQLTGSATDNTVGLLTYCWEQNDNASSAQTGSSSVANPTKTTGPNWISFKDTSSPTRLFPQLSTILAGQLVTGPLPGGDAGANIEALSSVSRTLNFRLTVRDKVVYDGTTVGQTGYNDAMVTVDGNSGPFAVTSPNTAVNWAGNSSQTITWSVNGTHTGLVNCTNVKISLSTDGGNTFTTILASTANDGSELVLIPNTPSATARIKVEAIGNIFFDISNSNFTIAQGSNCAAPTNLIASNISETSATLGWAATAGANSYDVDYKQASSTSWTSAAVATISTTLNLSNLTLGTLYDYRVRTNCASGPSSYSQAQFTTSAPCSAPVSLASSAITSSSATVSWAAVAGASSYAIDYKANTSTAWVTFSSGTTGTTVNLTGLISSTTYDWRVSANCGSAGNSAFVQAQFTTTAVLVSCPNPLDDVGNSTISGALIIPFNTDILGKISPKGDIDYYKFDLVSGASINMTLGTLPADYDLRLYNSSGSLIASSLKSGTSAESIIYTANFSGTFYAQISGYRNANNSTSCYTLKVAQSSGARQMEIEETMPSAQEEIRIFPNPTSGIITIETSWNFDSAEVSILSLQGKSILNKRITVSENIVDLSSLPSGMYLVQVQDGSSKTHKAKVIKD